MSDQTQISAESETGPWWRRELVQIGPEARRRLKRKYPTIQHLHEDIVSETMVQLIAHLSGVPDTLPPSWFGEDEPTEDEIGRFRAFVMTVLERRVMDHFRADFRGWAQEVSLHENGSQINELEHVSGEQDADADFDLMRAARALIDMLSKLPDRDRLLMEEVALGGRDGPLEAGERQRVSRLRRRLLKELGETLGQDPVQMLKHL
jgi:DNA-directed RNA polymerase specialized sigma24 family protein